MADKVLNLFMNILANVSPQAATPLPPCLSLFILHIPPPQPTFALVSYPLSKKIPSRL